jgi:hypothetical protein
MAKSTYARACRTLVWFLGIGLLSQVGADEPKPSSNTDAPQGRLTTMSPEDRKACGLDKLSSAEMTSLDSWIQKTCPCSKTPKTLPKNCIGESTLSTTEEEGHFLTLANGVKYEIPLWSAKKKTRHWEVGDAIRILKTKKDDWVRLENRTQDQSARAHVIIDATAEADAAGNAPSSAPQTQ